MGCIPTCCCLSVVLLSPGVPPVLLLPFSPFLLPLPFDDEFTRASCSLFHVPGERRENTRTQADITLCACGRVLRLGITFV